MITITTQYGETRTHPCTPSALSTLFQGTRATFLSSSNEIVPPSTPLTSLTDQSLYCVIHSERLYRYSVEDQSESNLDRYVINCVAQMESMAEMVGAWVAHCEGVIRLMDEYVETVFGIEWIWRLDEWMAGEVGLEVCYERLKRMELPDELKGDVVFYGDLVDGGFIEGMDVEEVNGFIADKKDLLTRSQVSCDEMLAELKVAYDDLKDFSLRREQKITEIKQLKNKRSQFKEEHQKFVKEVLGLFFDNTMKKSFKGFHVRHNTLLTSLLHFQVLFSSIPENIQDVLFMITLEDSVASAMQEIERRNEFDDQFDAHLNEVRHHWSLVCQKERNYRIAWNNSYLGKYSPRSLFPGLDDFFPTPVIVKKNTIQAEIESASLYLEEYRQQNIELRKQLDVLTSENESLRSANSILMRAIREQQDF